VVIANCYGSQSTLPHLFYRAGAGHVIAGPGPNFAAGRRVIGTDKLVENIIKGIGRGWSPHNALKWAKAILMFGSWIRQADKDTLEFRIIERKDETK
jgi:hypothetical protein